MTNLNTIPPKDFRYVILPSRFCAEENLGLLNQIYDFWFSGWSKVFADNKVDKVPNSEDFFRQDFVTAVLHLDQIAAVHFYSLYDFRTDLIGANNYVQDHFNVEFIAKCRSLGYTKLMSMESLLANPNYRKSKTGINFAHLMGSLGQNIFLNYTDAQCIFTPTRADNKTSDSGQGIGFKSVQSGVMVHNTPIDFLVCGRQDILPAPEPARFYVEHLWRQRHLDGQVAQNKTAA